MTNVVELQYSVNARQSFMAGTGGKTGLNLVVQDSAGADSQNECDLLFAIVEPTLRRVSIIKANTSFCDVAMIVGCPVFPSSLFPR